MRKNLAPKQRSLVACLRFAITAVFLSASAVTTFGQTNYPVLQNFQKPSPEPAAPGDAFTPPMAGTPAANTPEIAEWTRTAGPDESIALTGFNLSRFSGVDEGRDTRFFVYGRNGVSRDARIQRVDANKAVITIAKEMQAWSMYLIWPGNEAGYGKPIAVNKTESWWVGPDKATQGATVSVFGRNLAQNNDTLRSYVYVKAVGGGGQWANVTRVNPYRVDFTLPAGLANGEYEVWAHNGHGGQYGWSEPQKLTVYSGPVWTNTVFNVKNYGAAGNGYNDDTEAIRKAIDAARLSPGATLYFPAGTYMVSNFLHIYNNVKWKGDGKTNTTIKCNANFNSEYGMVIGNVSNTFSISNMGFDTNNNFRGNRDKPIILRNCTDVWIDNVRFSFKGFNLMDLHDSYRVFMTNTDHIGISTFLGNCSQLFIDKNNFYMTNDSEMALHTWGGIGISLTRSTCQDLDNSNLSSGAGWGKGRFFVGNGSWGSNFKTYLAFNRTKDLTPRPAPEVDQNSGEQFLWEGNLGQWAGFVSSSTATTTYLPGYSYQSQAPQYAVIIKGKGLGQSRQVMGNNGGTITIKEPWNVIPDASSRIVIGNFADRIAIYKNYFDGKDRAPTSTSHIAAAAVEPFGGSFNVIADNNTMNQLRQGIANWTTQHSIGLDPNYFNLYSNNTMTNVRWGMYNEVDRIYRPEGVAMLGVIYRKNNVNGVINSGFYNSIKTTEHILDVSVSEHNTISNAPVGSEGASFGAANQFFYKNTFSGVGTALTITPKMILRENNYLGVSTLYKYPLPMIMNSEIEAPLHVIDMEGSALGAVVKTNFTLQNSGIEPMNWVASSSAPWLTFSTISGTIADERGISLIELKANPANLAIGNHKAIITITAGEQVKKYTVNLILTAPKDEVVITAPAANAVLSGSQAITINANANNPNATITKVEFFAGSTKLGEDLSSPYSFSWNNAPAGNHSLTAKSITSVGTTTSAPVIVTVTPNSPPAVALTSPAANASFPTPASINISANASDTDGTIAKVEFFNGTTKLGESVSSPYTFTWYNVDLGSYSLTARATDNNGLTTTSSPVIVNVKRTTTPTVTLTSPGVNTSIKAPTNVLLGANAEYIDGYITKVAFYNGSTLISERTYAPYEIHWMNVPIGNYTVTARATNNLGITATSEAIKLSIVGQLTTINLAPTASITSPTATSNYSGPATVTINTNTADADGSIKKVEFFNGSIKLGESSTSPFSFNWNNVSPGTYAINVRATDNAGTSTTSAPVSFTVKTASNIGNVAPSVSITSPTENTSYSATASITINAIAVDADGTVSKVEFFNGNTKLGEDFTSPYTFTWNNVGAGNYALTAMAIDNDGSAANSSPVNVSVVALKTASAPTVTITAPANGNSFSAPSNITITANAADADGTVSKVEFFNGATKLGEDLSSPYSFTWSNVGAGNYTFTAKAIDNAGLTATSAPVQIAVSTTSTISCTATGTILREYWGNITGNEVSAIPLGTAPNASSQLTSFEAPSNVADNYGQRISGYICAPATGNYTFYISGDDNSELWLSTSDNPANKQKIASLTGWTSSRDWSKFSSQKSVEITLQANTKYYIEALNKEGVGWDNLAVGWITPGTSAIVVIPGAVLSPAINNLPVANHSPTVSLTSPTATTSFTAPATVTIAANAADADGTVSKVEFFNGTTKLGEDLSSPYSFSWSNVAAGSYAITAKTTDNSGLSASSAPVTITVSPATTATGVTVALTSPAVNSSLVIPTNLYVAAAVTSTEGSISKVEFYNGTTKLGEKTWAPYEMYVINAAAGSYTITAKAITSTGVTATSAPVSVSILSSAGTVVTPPTVSLTSPTATTSFTAPATVTIAANAADADGTVSKVEFFNGTTKLGEDLSSPYSFSWSNVAAGSYAITAKATDNSGLSATSAPVSIMVGNGTQACAGTGGITWDYWLNFPPWYSMSQIPVTTTPSGTKQLTSFETPFAFADTYAARTRGYVCPPTSGNYIFYLSGDDQADLFISTDSNPANKVLIAHLTTTTSLNQFDKDVSQQSKSIYLQAGQRYYIETLHIEGTGNDHVSVGWKLPNGTMQGPIPGSNLIPFASTDSQLLTSRAGDSEIESFVNSTLPALQAYPNPFSTRTTIEFALKQEEDYTLAVYDLKGSLVKQLQVGKAKANEVVRVVWEAGNLPTGIYLAKLITKTSTQNVKIALQ